MKKYQLLHREIAVSPLTLGIIHRGFHHKLQLKYTAPIYFKNSVIVYKDLCCDWYGDIDNFRDLGFKIIANAQADLKFRDRLLQETIKIGQRSWNFDKKINQTNLRKLNNRQLINYLTKLCDLGSDLCDIGMVAAAPDVAFNNFSKRLKKIIIGAIRRHKLSRSDNDYFNILTTSGQGSLSQEENITLIKLAVEISKNKNLLKLFKDQPVSELEMVLNTNYKEILNKILRIKNKYQWLSFGHLGPAKDSSDYLEDFKNIFNEGKINRKLIAIRQEKKELLEKQSQYFQELQLSEAEEQLFKTAQNFSYNKAYRYDTLLYTYFTLDKLLREISKRVSLGVNDLRFLSPEEIVSFLKSREVVKRSDIKERQKFCIVIIRGKGVRYFIGSQANNYLKNNIKMERIRKNMTVIHGMAAYLGRVTGRVKVIASSRDMFKVKEGDILVASQTTPDLVPAMKKAAAFVTDIGGITSHAAIVAREMKKPCIIGTKVASQVLKDHDLIEVNANEGDVMKL